MSKEDSQLRLDRHVLVMLLLLLVEQKRFRDCLLTIKIPKSKRDTWPIVENSQGMIILVHILQKILGIYIQNQYICGKIRNIYD